MLHSASLNLCDRPTNGPTDRQTDRQTQPLRTRCEPTTLPVDPKPVDPNRTSIEHPTPTTLSPLVHIDMKHISTRALSPLFPTPAACSRRLPAPPRRHSPNTNLPALWLALCHGAQLTHPSEIQGACAGARDGDWDGAGERFRRCCCMLGWRIIGLVG